MSVVVVHAKLELVNGVVRLMSIPERARDQYCAYLPLAS